MVGDDILKRIAGVIKSAIAEVDTQYYKTAGKGKEIMESLVGRLAGDEYAIFLPSRDAKEGIKTAEEIRKRIEKFPLEYVGGRITASIGVVFYPEHGVAVSDLFSKADAAVYRTKELGQNITHVYQTKDLVLERMRSRIVQKGRIQKAIEKNGFEPWFQPILDLNDNKIHHYEALARTRDKDGNIVLPGTFIETAEIFGQVVAIDKSIIEKTLKYQSCLTKQGKKFVFSVNLSGKDIGDIELLGFLKHKIQEIGADARRLILEITETAAIREFDKAVKFVHDLKALGCRFALDDFGVGFTSFKYLKEMEIDYIKIDGSFIRRINKDKSDLVFVKAIADVARVLRIKTIAEFVENEETVEILRKCGVDYAQGYFIGKPAPEVLNEG